MATKRKRDTKGNVLKKGEGQRENGTYMYRWTNALGKRETVYAKTLEELRDKEKIISMQNLIGILPSTITLNQQVEKYLTIRLPMVRETTARNYRSIVNRYIKDSVIGRKKVCDIKKSDLQIFYSELITQHNLSAGTLKIVNNLIRPALQLAVDDNIIMKNPAEKALSGVVTDNSSEKYALTIEEENEFLERLRLRFIWQYYSPLLIVLLRTGMRISEALGLTWNDVDMENMKISVNHQLILLYDNGKKRFAISPTKSKSGTRVIPMSEEVKRVLMFQRKSATRKDGYSVDGYTDFVFTNRTNGECIIYNTIYNIILEIKKLNNTRQVQLPHLTPHILRHTACSRFAEAGCDIKVLQYIMGHKDIKMTMAVYNHINTDRINKEFTRVNSVISKQNKLTPTLTVIDTSLLQNVNQMA